MDSDSNSTQRKVKCPQCGRLALYAPENPHRPFCSERCRLMDLGQWADETYRVPAEDKNPAEGVKDIAEEDLDDEGHQQ